MFLTNNLELDALQNVSIRDYRIPQNATLINCTFLYHFLLNIIIIKMLIAATCIIAHGRSTYVLSLGECPIHSPL